MVEGCGASGNNLELTYFEELTLRNKVDQMEEELVFWKRVAKAQKHPSTLMWDILHADLMGLEKADFRQGHESSGTPRSVRVCEAIGVKIAFSLAGAFLGFPPPTFSPSFFNRNILGHYVKFPVERR